MQIDNVNDLIFKEFVKNGYSRSKGKKVWDVAQRKFLYLTPDLSKAFLNLKNFTPYKKGIIDREIALMKSRRESLCKVIGDKHFNLIDVCCGDGTKVVEVLKGFDCKGVGMRYVPVNVSEHLVELALENVKRENFSAIEEYVSRVGDWDGVSVGEMLGKLRDNKYKRNIVLLMGSVIASFDINDYLFHLSAGMEKGDYLIIGNGIRTGERLVELEVYKNKAFHDWFIHIMRGLGFSDEEVEYDARFTHSRVEGFYKIKTDKKIEHEGLSVDFKKGDEIMVAYLNKFYEKELRKFCEMYFENVEIVKDDANEYAMVICRK